MKDLPLKNYILTSHQCFLHPYSVHIYPPKVAEGVYVFTEYENGWCSKTLSVMLLYNCQVWTCSSQVDVKYFSLLLLST